MLNASGYVTARRRATVSSKITGKVVEVNVEEGMAVKEGQVLARLDDSTPKAALALAEAQAEAARRNITENEVRLADARLTLSRRMQLVKERVVDAGGGRHVAGGRRFHRGAHRGRARAGARRRAPGRVQQTDLDNTVIRAPFSGVAISKDAQPGEMVSPVSAGGGFTRTGICTIVDMKSLEIDVDVNESYINRVRAGQDVTAVLDAYPDWQIPARVITMVPTADRQKATVLVRIGFKQLDPRILPDMGVKVTFLRDDQRAAAATRSERPVLLVPKAALRAENGQNVVFVVTRATAVGERRAVKSAGEDGDRLEVLAGLKPGRARRRVAAAGQRSMPFA